MFNTYVSHTKICDSLSTRLPSFHLSRKSTIATSTLNQFLRHGATYDTNCQRTTVNRIKMVTYSTQRAPNLRDLRTECIFLLNLLNIFIKIGQASRGLYAALRFSATPPTQRQRAAECMAMSLLSSHTCFTARCGRRRCPAARQCLQTNRKRPPSPPERPSHGKRSQGEASGRRQVL